MKYSGAGSLFLAKKDANGIDGPYFSVGCTDELPLNWSTEDWEHLETCSGANGVDATGNKKKGGEFSIALTEFNSKNWALATNGSYVASTTGTVTAETMPTGLVAGDIYATKHRVLTTVVVTDSAGSPATLALTTNYTLDAALGSITFVNVGAFVQPFKVAYGYTDPGYVAFMTQGTQYMGFRFEYKNMQNNGAKGLVKLYRVAINPATGMDLINPELQILKMTGKVLIDNTKSSSDPGGQFGMADGVPL